MTFLVLWWHSRTDLRPSMEDGATASLSRSEGRRAGLGILLAAGALLVDLRAWVGMSGPQPYRGIVAMFSLLAGKARDGGSLKRTCPGV